MGIERLRYRAKSKQTGQWCYGFPRKTTLGNWLMYCDDTIENIDPDTIGQYIGIDDRDGNGIFDGDIIHITDIADRYIVCYAATHARFLFLRQGRDGVEEPKDTRSWSYKIIGNIHEKAQTG